MVLYWHHHDEAGHRAGSCREVRFLPDRLPGHLEWTGPVTGQDDQHRLWRSVCVVHI